MLILRIRQAEVAADAGRLDEAFELVSRDSRFRSHRRGQEAITRIIAGFVKRAREHLDADRLPQAGADCEKAGKLGGGDLPDVTRLATDLRAKQLDRQRVQRDAAVAVATAKRHVEDGAFSIGRRVLAGVALDDSRAKRLMDDIDDQRARLDAAIAAAQSALDRKDWPVAAAAIERGRLLRTSDSKLIDLARAVAEPLAQQAQSEFNAGRLDRAAHSVRLLKQTSSEHAVGADLSRAIDHCTHAWASIADGRLNDAADGLRRVLMLFPKAGWVKDALEQVQQAADAVANLKAGPLSLSTDAADVPAPVVAQPATKRVSPPPLPGKHGGIAATPGGLPDRFILQVDGAGAFLIVRSSTAKIGPISSSALPDVALVADANAPAATIERVEDDYFLRTPSPVAVNDRSVTEKLLNAGDRIALASRCRFTFAVPHPASTTAVLDLDGARYPRGDVRRVILLDRDLILGPTAASHVRVSGLTEPVVLHLRDGTLRAGVEATAKGRPVSREEGLPVGVPVQAGGVSFVLSRV